MAMAKHDDEREEAGIDGQLWHACAGGMVQLPEAGSAVVYFPQGHIEHAASPPEIPSGLSLPGMIPCSLSSVRFLADRDTDEVYACLWLQPLPHRDLPLLSDPHLPTPPPLDKPLSFVKTLTQSDANNGGGFSVPRYCAETIFPRLDYAADPPVQTVLAKDVHGQVWKFRHIYRGTPRRHLLTTGWSTFVNQKKLVAGDAIVFLRSSTGELCVGVRRSTKSSHGGDSSVWHLSGAISAASAYRQSRWVSTGNDALPGFLENASNGADRFGVSREGRPSASGAPANFARNRARVTAKSVLEAITLAASGQPFEAVYYPRASISEFCVRAQAVKIASQQNWVSGMRFKMAFETEDSSRISWFMGSIMKVCEADPVLWPKSPWKMLQVSWDEPELLQGITSVSPWQVELVSRMQIPFTLPKKKPRMSQHPDILLQGQDIMQLNSTVVANNLLGPYNSLHCYMDSLPSGMQGARHDQKYGLALCSFKPNIQPGLLVDGFYQHADQLECGMSCASSDLNKGNFFHTGYVTSTENNFSALLRAGPPSDKEPALSTTALSCAGSSSTKSTTFVLFGKTINTDQTVKAHHQQISAGSYSDGPGPDSASEGNLAELPEGRHMAVSGQGKVAEAFDSWHQGESLDSSSNEIGSLNWFKEQAVILGKVNGDEDTTNCKVFKENEETGHTLTLSLFNSYEDLYGKISKMFTIEESEISNRLVYMDSDGLLRHTGKEPYRDFMKTAKWMKVLSESSSESMT